MKPKKKTALLVKLTNCTKQAQNHASSSSNSGHVGCVTGFA
jgi:hypothetical protein